MIRMFFLLSCLLEIIMFLSLDTCTTVASSCKREFFFCLPQCTLLREKYDDKKFAGSGRLMQKNIK